MATQTALHTAKAEARPGNISVAPRSEGLGSNCPGIRRESCIFLSPPWLRGPGEKPPQAEGARPSEAAYFHPSYLRPFPAPETVPVIIIVNKTKPNHVIPLPRGATFPPLPHPPPCIETPVLRDAHHSVQVPSWQGGLSRCCPSGPGRGLPPSAASPPGAGRSPGRRAGPWAPSGGRRRKHVGRLVSFGSSCRPSLWRRASRPLHVSGVPLAFHVPHQLPILPLPVEQSWPPLLRKPLPSSSACSRKNSPQNSER